MRGSDRIHWHLQLGPELGEHVHDYRRTIFFCFLSLDLSEYALEESQETNQGGCTLQELYRL